MERFSFDHHPTSASSTIAEFQLQNLASHSKKAARENAGFHKIRIRPVLLLQEVPRWPWSRPDSVRRRLLDGRHRKHSSR
eukprot:4088941-Pleurochrysis_carterae.AAC.1